jgi:aryl-alcohol dehydrogenase-like predicted oxidoreductase
MRYRTLGNTSLRTSVIGFGCWETGGEYGSFDKTEFLRAVNAALDLGVTLFDTARGYGFGASESLLGEALKTRRAEAIVCTKIGIFRHPDGTWDRDSSRGSLLQMADSSLKALNLDYVDLLLIHWPDRSRSFEEPMQVLVDLQRQGKTRFVGVSNFKSSDLLQCAQLAPIIANQVGYNLFDRRWEYEMFQTAEELGISIMAYGPLAHGLLAGEVGLDTSLTSTDWRSKGQVFGQPLFIEDNLRRNIAVVSKLAQVAEGIGITLPQLAIAWVLKQPVVGTALTGVRTALQITENASAADIELNTTIIEQMAIAMGAAAGLTAAVPD